MHATASRCLLLLGAFAAITAPASVARANPEVASAPSASLSAPGLQTKVLENGLTVVVQEDERTPLVSVVLRYDVGERAAPEGLHGIATLTQMLAAQESAHVPSGDASRLLWRAGASFDDWTTTDSTVLSVTLPAYRLALPLWLWSDQMGFFRESLSAESVRRRRTELVERMRDRRLHDPLARIDAFADEELFPATHPYHELVGTPESVARIERAQVLAFHDRWMTPDHATLVVVGNVKALDAFAEVERYFGPIPASTERSRVPSPPLPQLAGETIVEVEARVTNAHVYLYWPTPRVLSAEDAELDVVAGLLSGAHRAFLSWEIVTDQKVALSVGAFQRSRPLASVLMLSIEGAPGKTAIELLAAFDKTMDALMTRPFSQADVNLSVYAPVVQRVYSLERGALRAAEYAKYVGITGTPDYLIRDLTRYQRITPAVATQAMTRYLPRDRRVVVLVSPSRTAEPGGERKARRTIAARQP
jgi:zinc protease